MQNTELEFFASCLGGLEQLLSDELKSFGIERVRPLGGGVAFFCEAPLAYRACLWSRLASRIMLVLGRVNAGDADLLYAGAYDIAWEEVLAPDATMAVRAHGTNDSLRNTRFTALKVKDAIADKLRETRSARPRVDKVAPRAAIDVRMHEKRATVSLDFSGEALSHRSYLGDDDGEDAALNCSKAAGMLALAGWTTESARGRLFVDPACRDGILLTEAASIACDRASGLARDNWGFRGWTHHDESAWRELLAEAEQRFMRGLCAVTGLDSERVMSSAPPDADHVRFLGMSGSSPLVSRARNHVRRAGLRQAVSVERPDPAAIDALQKGAFKTGVVFWETPANVSEGAVSSSSSEGLPFADGAEGASAPKENVGSTAPRKQRNPWPLLVASDLDALARADSPADVLSDETAFVAACAAAPAGSVFVAAGGSELAARFGKEPVERCTVGKGRIETTVEVFDAPPEGGKRIQVIDLADGKPRFVEVLEPASEQFAARLRKVFKERRKWAARAGVSCYRIYDSDLPDYALAIDWYTGAGDARGNDYLHIAEYAPPASIDEGKARRRFTDALTIAPVVCGVRPDHVFAKRRMRDKGGSQYRNAGTRAYRTTVEEGGFLFEVDLSGRLDTGLFLDHRITRSLVRDSATELASRSADAGETKKQTIGRDARGAKPKANAANARGGMASGASHGIRFLNLFAYTGTASVYAAAGGAVATTTVDLSANYLDWAKRNMAENGYAGKAHSFVRADVLKWITQARRAQERYDLIFVDPPTFSNSKAMGKKTWDVQRDHVELLIGVSRLLAEGGLAIFSCNLRSFKPDVEKLAHYGVEIEDISMSTIPEDFARTPKIHKCYLIRRIARGVC